MTSCDLLDYNVAEMATRKPRSKEARALDIATKIAQIRAELAPLQEMLRQLEAEFKRIVGEADAPPAAPAKKAAPAVQLVHVRKGTIADRVLGFLGRERAEHTVQDIAEGAGGVNVGTVRSVLMQLAKDGRVERVRHGVYVMRRIIESPAAV